jgi:parallel beta-helix repeat protein
MCFLVALMLVSADAAHGTGFAAMPSVISAATANVPPNPPSNRTVLFQPFDNETTGAVPQNWTVSNPSAGSFVIDNTSFHGIGGKSARLVDNSTSDSPRPYVSFTPQNSTLVVSFSIMLNDSVSGNAVVDLYVDDGSFNGSDLMFENGGIGYRGPANSFVPLRSPFVPNRWYVIKMIMNIPENTYDIHIDDHLELLTAASFTGPASQIERIILNETSGSTSLPTIYLDDLEVRQSIVIPRDFATIQEGINAANPGDIVFVSKQRTYFEQVTISKNIWLVGEDVHTTIINLDFLPTGSFADGVTVSSENAQIYSLTISSTQYGAGIRVSASNCVVANNNVTNGLGDGIIVDGSGNTITGNVIQTNLKDGLCISGSNSVVTNNTINSNDQDGVFLNGNNSTIADNYVGSSLGHGVNVASGNYNLIRNNTIRNNDLGIYCGVTTANNTIYQNRFVNNGKESQAVDKGANAWDDGYPYNLTSKTGGGNYWSDFSSADMYSGVNRNERATCGLALPDGICDEPYNLSSKIQDRYPLFLIQSVVQNPGNVSNIEYDTSVNVTVKVLGSVKISAAFLFIEYDSQYQNITMTVANDTLNGTIPSKPYGTLVNYNVSVHAEFAVELNSTSYPLAGPYSVGDKKSPSIGQIGYTPSSPDNNQNIRFWAVVTEPVNASGVNEVVLSYLFNGTVWKADMTKIVDDNYTALMPAQPGNVTLFFNVSAVDKAGNWAVKSSSSFVNKTSQLSVSNGTATLNPSDVDTGVMYRGQTASYNVTLYNIGQEPLAWNASLGKDGAWLKSVTPNNGTIGAGNSTAITLSIDTSACDPNLYVAELTINANGSVPQWLIVVRVTVRDITIDDSWASMQAPARSDVNVTQYYGFHVEWAHNCTDVVSGKINVVNVGSVNVNGTGWANFNYTSANPAEKAFSVVSVDFLYVKDGQSYHIKSFTQKVSNITTIWDRINIVLKVADGRIDVGSSAILTWNDSFYEFDNSAFNGTLYTNDTLIKNEVGKHFFTASGITDDKYNLTKFRSNVVACIWDRIKIIGGGPSQQTESTGNSEQVWFIAIYEYDNMLFKGPNGTLFIDTYAFNQSIRGWQLATSNEPLVWSSQNDRWEKSYSFDTQGSRRFTVSRVEDNVYNLTVINDVVGPSDITWLSSGWSSWFTPASDQTLPVQNSLEMPFWAVVSVASTLAIGLIVIVILLIMSGKNHGSKGKLKGSSRSHRG